MNLGTALDTMRATREAYNASKSDAVEVGSPATIILYSDRKAATVVEVIRWKSGPRKGSPRRIIAQADTSTRTDTNGMSDSQSYAFERNPNGTKYYYNRKDGAWRNTGTRLAIGWRDTYHDYSF